MLFLAVVQVGNRYSIRMTDTLITLEIFVRMMERQGQGWKDLVEMLYNRMPHDELVELTEEWKEEEKEEEEDEDETDGWETVYNGNGTRRMYCEQPGTFYQTYGNGGGKNGWGGYWVREDGEAVWEVAGEEFTYLNGCYVDFQTENEMTGRIAMIRIVPLKLERPREDATCVVCNETKTEDWAWNTTAVKNAPVCGDCLETQ